MVATTAFDSVTLPPKVRLRCRASDAQTFMPDLYSHFNAWEYQRQLIKTPVTFLSHSLVFSSHVVTETALFHSIPGWDGVCQIKTKCVVWESCQAGLTPIQDASLIHNNYDGVHNALIQFQAAFLFCT
jgi:hypothetical protein